MYVMSLPVTISKEPVLKQYTHNSNGADRHSSWAGTWLDQRYYRADGCSDKEKKEAEFK